MKIEFSPIGIVHTPFKKREGMPIQPPGAAGAKGTIELFPEYHEGLKDLDGFSHIILLYFFHRSEGYTLRPVPFMDTQPRGLFSTRAPRRPNSIGLSTVEVYAVEEGVIHVGNIDVLDETPLLDIKPYVPAFDPKGTVRCGWMEEPGKRVDKHRSDDRFV
ncbi:MAG: tRNA (N6-threonylcarbamoyladenosine(37)-N6)-methyltransferase TrmO [Chitinivibrionales bacterium]